MKLENVTSDWVTCAISMAVLSEYNKKVSERNKVNRMNRILK